MIIILHWITFQFQFEIRFANTHTHKVIEKIDDEKEEEKKLKEEQ